MSEPKQQVVTLAWLREHFPDKAAEVEALLAQQPGGGLQAAGDLKVKVGIRMRLEKFDGDYAPGQRPVEVIESHDTIEQTIGGMQ